MTVLVVSLDSAAGDAIEKFSEFAQTPVELIQDCAEAARALHTNRGRFEVVIFAVGAQTQTQQLEDIHACIDDVDELALGFVLIGAADVPLDTAQVNERCAQFFEHHSITSNGARRFEKQSGRLATRCLTIAFASPSGLSGSRLRSVDSESLCCSTPRPKDLWSYWVNLALTELASRRLFTQPLRGETVRLCRLTAERWMPMWSRANCSARLMRTMMSRL